MKHISANELHKLMETENLYLLDVREVYEHETNNIGGELIPLGDIINQGDKIPKHLPVIVYCKKGIRSQIAIQRLEDKFGFTNLVNLSGGIEAWMREKDKEM